MNHTLLLADDEEGIRKVLGIALADSGFEVLTAENGLEALEIVPERAAGHRAHRHQDARAGRHRAAAHRSRRNGRRPRSS
ncbi:MAG: hypothetical protein MZV70_20005 [Desulfobacterales bacterium]|nr:hypothetical protein [Desulfobacterales bacterium]